MTNLVELSSVTGYLDKTKLPTQTPGESESSVNTITGHLWEKTGKLCFKENNFHENFEIGNVEAIKHLRWANSSKYWCWWEFFWDTSVKPTKQAFYAKGFFEDFVNQFETSEDYSDFNKEREDSDKHK